MPKYSKPIKVDKSVEAKSSAKKNTTKQKLNDSSKSKAENEEIENMVIEDEKWQCSIVSLVPENYSIYNFLLQILINLPENFTLITKDDIANTKDNKSRKRSKSRTSVWSTSNSSKKSSKTKKIIKKSKKEIRGKEHPEKSSNNEVDNFKECLILKKRIISLRNTDIANINKNITDNKTDKPQSNIKDNHMSNRDSVDEIDNKITATEENLTCNENTLHRFVILLGFYDPLLPEVLNKQNVSLKAIINVSNSVDENINTKRSEKLSTVTAKSKRKTSNKSKKRSLDGKVSNEYSVFLEKICAFSITDEFLEKFKNVVFINYYVKNILTEAKETELKHKSGMLRVFYKIKEAWNKYKEYTKTIYVQNIPMASECLKLDDAKIYSTMISMVPLECTSTAVILHCILEQIAWWNDEKKCRKEINNLLSNDSGTHCNTYTTSKSFSKNITPIIIHHRDEIKYNTFHLDLPEFDFEHISTNCLMKSPVFKLWERYPPHPKSVRKWFDFQLQKLQNLSNSFILKLDSLFPIYLHYLLMSVLTFKTIKISNSINDTVGSKPEIKEVYKIFSSTKKPEGCDVNSNLFVKEILYNILGKVPNLSLCHSYTEVFEVNPHFSVETTECNRPSLKQSVYPNRLRSKQSQKFPGETLKQKRELKKQEKLNKLVSFLNCSEFVSLYEDLSKLNFRETNRLAKHEFVEMMNTKTLCQSLHQAYQTFSNINYDYFPVTDSILLWFNNSVQDKGQSCSTTKGVLETPLGFRDFYSQKLRESTIFGDLIKEEGTSRQSLENVDDLFVDELITDPEARAGHHFIVKNNEKHFRDEAPNPKVVYNLGSLRMEYTETFNNYFSADSSSVTVKTATYFNNKVNTVVNVNKNNTSLRYELDSESSKHLVQLIIDVNETLSLNCVLKWDIVPHKSPIQKNTSAFSENFDTVKDSQFKVNCSINITLPSGLFIEVVPTNSIFGPFYIRQRYLGKGPNCSNIWDEKCRCYFNNGMVLIFRIDGSVDILYNNGTIVKCHPLELIKPDDLLEVKINKKDINIKESDNGDFNNDVTHRTKEDKNNTLKKKGKVKADPTKTHTDVNRKDSNKQRQQNIEVKKESMITTQNQQEKILLMKETEDNVPLYKVVHHSVLSWDGEYSKYDSGRCTGMKKSLSLRTAFDVINHELYWQRNDGMTSLQSPNNHVIKFPDGSKTTLTGIDNKELWVERDNVIIYYTSGDLVKVEPFIVSHSTADSNHKKHLIAADIVSMDSFGTESLEEKGFVYIENGFLMEHTNYASVEYSNEEHKLILTLPGNCWVAVDENGQFSFTSNIDEKIILFNKRLCFEANVLSSSTLTKSRTTLRFENVDTIPVTFSQTEDSFGNIFSVDERGNTTYSPSVRDENSDQPHSSLMYSARLPQNTERFFVFNRDLTGYEMIHEVVQANTLSNEDVRTVTTPVLIDDCELYSLYMQIPIYRSKCEEFIMHNIDDINLSLIKRKDLLKAHKTPETIWFNPVISSVKKLTETNEIAAHPTNNLRAIMIGQRLKALKKGLNVVLLFSKSFSKYMEFNEQIYQKYFNYHPKDILKEKDLIESEKNRTNFLGSKSYYLTDNLPVVITGEMASEKHPREEIVGIFSP